MITGMIGRALKSKAQAFIAIQSLFYAFANSIEALVPFLLAPILTRMLDPEAYGIWVLFVTYATFVRPLVGLTIQDAIRMRFYDFDRRQLDQFTHTALFVMFVLAIFVSIVTLLFGDLLESATMFPQAWLVSVVIAAFLFEAFYIVLALQQFHNRRRDFLITQCSQAALSLIFIVAFLLGGWDWRGVVLGRMIGMAISTLFSMHSLGFTLSSLLRVPKPSFYKNIASFGVIYWPAGAVIMAVATIGKVVAAHYLGVEASAMYGVAALFASAFWIANYSFVMAWTPWLFRRLSAGAKGNLTEIASVSMSYFMLSALAGVVFYYVALIAAPVLLGEAFHSAIDLLEYIILAAVLQGWFVHNMKFLHFDKRIAIMSGCSVLIIGSNLWLSIAWAQDFGIRGIMVAAAVSFGAGFLITGALILARFINLRQGAEAVAG